MLAWLLLTYLVGSVPFGLVLATLYGGDVDIRTAGSGNVGATNVARLYGWRLGLASLFLDAAKGAVFTAGAWWLWPDAGLWFAGLVAVVAFLGHCFSVYLEFRGGKGVATAAGAMLVLSPLPTLLAVAVWLVALRIGGRSSVAALVASLTLLLLVTWLDPSILGVVVVLVAGIVATHTANIRRLIAGEEAAVVRPVRWGRRKELDPAELLAQGPAGPFGAPPLWKEQSPDPLDLERDITLQP